MSRPVVITLIACSAGCVSSEHLAATAQWSFYIDGATLFAPPGTDPNQLAATLDAGMQAVQPIGYPNLPALTVYLEPHRVSVYESGFDSVADGDEVHFYSPIPCLAESDLAHALAHWMRWSITGDADPWHLDSQFWGAGGVAESILSAEHQWCAAHQQ